MTTAPPQARPASTFEPLVLLQMVRDIAESSRAEDTERISTRAWDSAITLSDRFADAPPARRISEHLELPWPKVRELAFLPPVSQHIALGHALNERQGYWLTLQYSDYVLALVAHRIGARTLTPGQYRAERARILATRRAGAGALRLPTEDQIAALAGSWDIALANAGLGPRRARGYQPPRQAPLTIVEALERCYEYYETEPTSAELDAFAKANGIPITRDRTRSWASQLTEWKTGRRAAGLPVPTAPPPRNQRWDYTQSIGAARPGERRRGTWTRDQLTDWLTRYLAQLRPRQQSRERGSNDWAAGQPGAPSSSAFDTHGGWDILRAEAQTELRRRRRAGTTSAPPAAGAVTKAAAAKRRRSPSAGPGRRATAALAELVATGVLCADEALVGTYKGRGWRATFDSRTGAVSVEGEGNFDSLTAAAIHCHDGGSVSGFAFWGVERDGRVAKLNKLASLGERAERKRPATWAGRVKEELPPNG